MFDLNPIKLVILEPRPKELKDFPDFVENFLWSLITLEEFASLLGS